MSKSEWIFPELAKALSNFVSDALRVTKTLLGEPRFGYPRYEIHDWRRSERDPQELREIPLKKVWLFQYDRDVWFGHEALTRLPSFRELERLLAGDELLQRRIMVATGIVMNDLAVSLFHFVQHVMLDPLVSDMKSLDFDQEIFDHRYAELEEALISLTLRSKFIVALRRLWVEDDVKINKDITLRRLSDEELSEAIVLGIVSPMRSRGGSAFLSSFDQMAICCERITEIDDNVLASDDLRSILARADAAKVSDDLADKVVAVCNLFGDNGGTEIAGSWLRLERPLGGLVVDGDASTGAPYDGTNSSGIRISDASAFLDLLTRVSKGSVWKRLEVGLSRFSSASCRSSAGEAIVDLAIAAESLFIESTTPGEATHKISLNAALLLGDREWPPSEVRAFFTEVYKVRSKYVHGVSKSTNAEFREKLEAAMRKALQIAILQLSNDPQALNWPKRLDSVLDTSVAKFSEGDG